MTESVHIRRTYTPEQRAIVEQYEDCCRLYMGLAGQDADRKLEMKHPTIIGAKVFCQAWEALVPEFYDFELRFLAMMQTRAERAELMAAEAAKAGEPDLKLVRGGLATTAPEPEEPAAPERAA
jgi:hypothetical protein